MLNLSSGTSRLCLATVLWACALPCFAPNAARAREDDAITLRFQDAMAAVISATHWDQTQQKWAERTGDADAMFFDAAYRFLLLRFPGSAEALHERLGKGYSIESAHLELRRSSSPWPRAPGYYARCGWLRDTPEPDWQVGVSALRRVWVRDEEIGPTWNAYINGAGWWRSGGARTLSDSFALAETEMSSNSPSGSFDVTRAFHSPYVGATAAERLRKVDDHGFLVRRTQRSHYVFGDQSLDTAAVPLYVEGPVLAVRLRRTSGTGSLESLPPATDVYALAGQLQAAGGDGFPSTRMPDNLKELVSHWRERRRGNMPEWMWERVQEVFHLPHYDRDGREADADSFTVLLKALDSADEERYAEEVMTWELDRAPGWFKGHSNIQDPVPLRAFPELLTDVLRYDREMSVRARWTPPLRPDMLHSHTLGGTFNHQAQYRSTALLGAEIAGLLSFGERLQYLLSLLNRHMIYADGYTQEMGDSYYRGISMLPLQTVARFSADPLMRLKASLMNEKLRFEDITTYHPGLRQRVSRVSRRMRGVSEFGLGQNVPEAALHTLSRKGVMIETDRLHAGHAEVHGVSIEGMYATPPVHVALVAPWGQDWESYAIDEKPMPFRSVFANYPRCRSRNWRRAEHPVYAVTYMGHNYALASEQTTGGSVSLFAAWRTHDRPVERLAERGIMMLQGRVNNMEPDVMDKTPTGNLQHDNKLIWVIKSPERHFMQEKRFADIVERGVPNMPDVQAEGLFNLRAQVAVHAWGREALPEIWINDRRLQDLPTTAAHSDAIFLKEGVTYIGLVPLPATDLGRDRDILIQYEEPTLTIASHIMDREVPLELTDELWETLRDATAGWVVEFGDVTEHGSFDAFRAHVQAARLRTDWDARKRILHIVYASGDDTMEMGFKTDFERFNAFGHVYDYLDVFDYQRVNGQWPWPPGDVRMDSPLGQMGDAEVLRKAGASLRTVKGRTALLRVEPNSRTYVGINPYIDPTPFELETPEGARIQSEGPLGLARVTVQPLENRLRVDCALPPPEGVPGIEQLQDDRPDLFAPGVDVRRGRARAESARALLVSGLGDAPSVILNDCERPGPFARVVKDGTSWLRIPISE